MTDIFFSYSSKDRERVRPVRDALAAQGFDVFWDQQVPAGVDWDTWIRQHLQRARCAVVFWSANSVASDNVRHEATVAKTQGKLVPVLIEELRPDQFPMGLYSVQGANLSAWSGESTNPEWQKLQAEVEAKLTPLWVTAKLHDAEAAVLAEKARREASESRIRALQEQLAKEAQAQHAAEQAREAALAEADGLRAAGTAAEAARDEALRRAEAAERGLHACRQALVSLEEQHGTLTAELKARDGRGGAQALKLQEDAAPATGVDAPRTRLDVICRAIGTLCLLLVPVALGGFLTAEWQRNFLSHGPNPSTALLIISALTGAQIFFSLLLRRSWKYRAGSFVKLILVLFASVPTGFNVFLGAGFGFFGLR
jgi:hypothetical protein